MFGLILIPVIGWAGGTFFGAVAASYMPQALTNAMGIALYGMFIAIIVGPAREEKSVMVTIILAIIASLAFSYLPLLKNISGGWSIIIITVIVSAIAAWLFPIKVDEEEDAQEKDGNGTGQIEQEKDGSGTGQIEQEKDGNGTGQIEQEKDGNGTGQIEQSKEEAV